MAFGRTVIARSASSATTAISAGRAILRGRARSSRSDVKSIWTPVRAPPSGLGDIRCVSTSSVMSRATSSPKTQLEASSRAHPMPDPLNPAIPLSSLGLPLQPLPLPTSILHPPTVPIDSSSLHNLHRLSAISPPTSRAEEERLTDGLGKLIGLMEGVKDVKLDYETLDPAEAKRMIREDLIRGFWADPEDVFDGSDVEEEMVEITDEAVRGRQLLGWSKRVKDGQYIFDAPQR